MNNIYKLLLGLLAATCVTTAPAIAQWSIVGTAGFTGAVANNTEMAVDQYDVPYIAFRDNANGDKLSVRKWTGSSWSSIGTAISNSSVDYVSMAIDQNSNYIYVAYKDWSASGKLSVKMYNGSSWSTLGYAISSSSVDYVSASVSPQSGKLYIAYKDNSQSGKASIVYNYYGNWYYLGGAGFTSTSVSYTSLVITPSGYGYMAYRDNSNNPRVVQWTSNGWASTGTVSGSGCSDVTIASDANDVPYIAYIDWNNSSKLTVRKYSNSSWSSVGSAGFTPNGVGTPDLAIDQNTNIPYIVYRDNNNNQKASVMKYDNGSWTNVGSAGFTSNTVDYTSLAIDDNGVLYVGYKDNAVGQKATVMKYSGSGSNFGGITWDGSSSSDWNTASNWSTNAVPTSGDDVLIPSGLSRYPNVNTSTTIYCADITVQSGASFTLNYSTSKLRVYGDISNSGSFNAPAGRIEMRGSSAQTITSTSTLEFDEFRLYNSSGCTLNDSVAVTDIYYPSNGTLTTNGKFILRSTSSNTAQIKNGSTGGNYISGNVVIERYIPGGQRAYRFMAHPFSTSIPLSQLTDDIDITGQGGTSNGFTQVQVNAPSAFWFDVTTADTSTAGNNPGWKDFTSAYTNSWAPYMMARIMMRGTKGQGLTQGSYTPNAVTIDMTGPVNQGNKTVTLPKGNNSEFVICGNPYPSQVDLSNVSRSNNIGANFCVWDPHQGTFGGYTSYQFSSSYILPACGAFVAEVTSGSSGSFYFQESDKTSSNPDALFKTTADPIEETPHGYTVEMNIEDNNIFWDRLIIDFDSSANVKQDDSDMIKFYNPDLDFYTLMDDSTRISIDVRPFEDGKTIPLGIAAYEDMNLFIKVPRLNAPQNAVLYLHDKFTNKTELMSEGYQYAFSVDMTQPGSYGNDRFSINMVDTFTSVHDVNARQTARLQLAPNPASNSIQVSFTGIEGNGIISITDITGKVVFSQQVNTTSGKLMISVAELNNGIYIVALNAEGIRLTEKLVKQQ